MNFLKTLLVVNVLIGLACLCVGSFLPICQAAANVAVFWPTSFGDDED